MTYTTVTQISALSTHEDRDKLNQIVQTVAWSSQYQWMKQRAEELKGMLVLERRVTSVVAPLLILSTFLNLYLGLWLWYR